MVTNGSVPILFSSMILQQVFSYLSSHIEMNVGFICSYVVAMVLILHFDDRIASGRTKIANEPFEAKANESVSNAAESELKLFLWRLQDEIKRSNNHWKRSEISCRACQIFLGVVREFWSRERVTHLVAIEFTVRACTVLGMQQRNVCQGVVNEYHKELFYVLSKIDINMTAMCGSLLDKDCGAKDSLEKPWNISLPNVPKPPVDKVKPFKPGSPVMKVLHLTDLHIDLQYKENTSSTCGEPICCRDTDGPGYAGYWGSYGCDIPMRTFESALQHIKENHKDLSYILLTGDIPPHDVWEDTKKGQIEIMRRTLEKLAEYFPDKKVFVAAGNYDTHPTNSFPPPAVGTESIAWLLDTYADMWSVWLPNSALSTVRKGGFYTVLVSEGFRIISINNNYCNTLNWWLLVNNTDPVGGLRWLIQVLQNAEDKGEKVHIIAHIPTGNNLCFKYWSWNYYKIINRYESTVAAQFCGHTHKDHFEIFYDLADRKRPVSLWYVAPSLTTSREFQPSYRIYEIDGDHENSSRVVLNHKTFKLNLETSNENRRAIWELEYSAKDAYNMTSLLPKDWDALTKRMENDEKLFQKFYRFKYRYPLKQPCDEDCKKREICLLRTARSHDKTFCNTHSDNIEL